MELYLDDSGSRFPDLKNREETKGRMDCFALGGILFHPKDLPEILAAYDFLCDKWRISYPLHSNSIRTKTGKFAWLGKIDPARREEFLQDLDQMIEKQRFVAVACVIHRPGYNARYKALYGDQRWMLCKTAYAILIERAAKFARSRGLRLRVNFEESGKHEDRAILAYHRELKKTGMPFAVQTSSKYKPLSAKKFRAILKGDPKRHKKASRPAQIADLVLFPMARGRYEPSYRTYRLLRDLNKLIDCVVKPEQVENLGVKYSCFD